MHWNRLPVSSGGRPHLLLQRMIKDVVVEIWRLAIKPVKSTVQLLRSCGQVGENRFPSMCPLCAHKSPVTLELKVENARAALKRCPFEHSAAVLHKCK
jgi:hypothetical protein